MKTLQLITALLVAATFPAIAKNSSPPVVIDAAFGNTDVEVQAALDANPEGTTFVLTGAFVFSDHVHVEKSGTRILGDWEDSNANGKPDEADAWITTITAIPNAFGLSEAFLLVPTDEVAAADYDVRDIEISGIHFFGINFPVAALPFSHPDQIGCRIEPLPYHLENVRLQGNWLEGGGFWIYRDTSRVHIDNNLFTLFQGNELFRHAIEMRGLSYVGCDEDIRLAAPGQRHTTISNNIFRSARDISVGTQFNLLVSGNVMTGTRWVGDYKVWISQASGALIRDNLFQGGPADFGVNFWTRSNWPDAPDTTSDAVSIIDNQFIDTAIGVGVFGGTEKTTIEGNTFSQSGAFGPAGFVPIGVTDVFRFAWGGIVAETSRNVVIKHNDIGGAGLVGVLVNGGTTGVAIKNNAYDNPYAQLGDVYLAGEDVLNGFGDLLCPANGNKVISDLPLSAVVVNEYTDRCPDDPPNKLQGDGIFEVTP